MKGESDGSPFLFYISCINVLMKTVLPALLITLILASCGSNTTEESSGEPAVQEEPTTASLTSLSEHLNFTSQFFMDQSFAAISFADLQKPFNLSDQSEHYEDSVVLTTCTLHRQFIFAGDSLVGVKLSSFSDSTQMVEINANMSNLLDGLSQVLGATTKATNYYSQWNASNTSFKLKLFPTEGVDFLISNSSVQVTTQCVGDMYAASSKLYELVGQYMAGSLSIDTLSPVNFEGILLQPGAGELDLIYACKVSPKLMMVDEKTLQNGLSELVGSKPSLQDGMYFWTIDSGKIQFDLLENGFSVKFIQ
jgi:hypothetical protein